MPQHSAMLPAYGSKSSHANHMNMTKFESAEDPGFVNVSTTLWRWAKDLAKETTGSSVMPEVWQSQSEISESRPRPLAIEVGRSQGQKSWWNVKTFG